MTLATAYTPSGVQASDLTVNGIAADSFTLTNSTHVTFHYDEPVTLKGSRHVDRRRGDHAADRRAATMAAFSAYSATTSS